MFVDVEHVGAVDEGDGEDCHEAAGEGEQFRVGSDGDVEECWGESVAGGGDKALEGIGGEKLGREWFG